MDQRGHEIQKSTTGKGIKQAPSKFINTLFDSGKRKAFMEMKSLILRT
jgi:hypothetical protein